MVALSDLVNRLTAAVPAQDGTPSAEQYEAVVKDAVATFNSRAGRVKQFIINITRDQADYEMPDDFFKLIRLESLTSGALYGTTVVTEQGLVPLEHVGLSIPERYTVVGNTLTIVPTPTYSRERRLWYRAVHVLNDSDEYPDMTEAEASIILLKAIANAWRLVGSRVSAQKGWAYQAGDIMIDRRNASQTMETWVRRYDEEFDRQVKAYVGTVGMRGDGINANARF